MYCRAKVRDLTVLAVDPESVSDRRYEKKARRVTAGPVRRPILGTRTYAAGLGSVAKSDDSYHAERRTTPPSAMSAVPTSTMAASSRNPGKGNCTCCTATAASVDRALAASSATGVAAAIEPATSVHPAKTAVPTNLRMTRTPEKSIAASAAHRRSASVQAECHARLHVFLKEFG